MSSRISFTLEQEPQIGLKARRDAVAFGSGGQYWHGRAVAAYPPACCRLIPSCNHGMDGSMLILQIVGVRPSDHLLRCLRPAWQKFWSSWRQKASLCRWVRYIVGHLTGECRVEYLDFGHSISWHRQTPSNHWHHSLGFS